MAACWTSGLSWCSIFWAGKKCKLYLFFSSLKCKSTRRLCKKGLGSRQRAAAYPRCRCRSAHETAQHITCSQICCTGFLCVRVSFRIQQFYFLHIALNSSGSKYMAARSSSPTDLSSCQRRAYSLSCYIFLDWHCYILKYCFENWLK